MRRLITIASFSVCVLTLGACDDRATDGPPDLRLGEDVCVQCNMIISDRRWATATIVEGPRGPEPRLFDDFNCQVRYEVKNDKEVVVHRWSHDHGTSQWLPTGEATFIMADKLRTPMGSRVAAFASPEAAAEAARAESGEVLTFDVVWKRLGYSGSPSVPDHGSHEDDAP